MRPTGVSPGERCRNPKGPPLEGELETLAPVGLRQLGCSPGSTASTNRGASFRVPSMLKSKLGPRSRGGRGIRTPISTCKHTHSIRRLSGGQRGCSTPKKLTEGTASTSWATPARVAASSADVRDNSTFDAARLTHRKRMRWRSQSRGQDSNLHLVPLASKLSCRFRLLLREKLYQPRSP